MTGQNIIDRFEIQVDDVTELSTTEELAVLNRVYKRILGSRVWSFLKTSASGTASQDSNGYYITLPSDFMWIISNAGWTDNTMESGSVAAPKVIFVGSNYDPIQIVNWSDRRQYRTNNKYAYIDLANNQIRFTATPSSTTYEFDYQYMPDDLTTATSPVFPSQFHDFLAYGMAVENDIIQLSEKAKSYQRENLAMFNEDLTNMIYYDSQQMYD